MTNPIHDTQTMADEARGATDDLRGEAARSVQNPLPKATPLEAIQVLRDVQLPMVAKGPIIRRPAVVSAVAKLGLEGRAVRRMQTLSDKYGRGPLMMSIPGRTMALVLDPDHVHRVLDDSPEPFATAESLKREALKHFEPRNALVSHGDARAHRRELNEQALNSDKPVHAMSEHFMPVVTEEASALLQAADGRLSWDDFEKAWHRVVRRVVLGDSARDDTELTELIEKLRSRGNWAFMRPVDTGGRDELIDAVREAMRRAEPGSLAAYMNELSGGPASESADDPDGSGGSTAQPGEPEQQIPQWLFAFDPAGMATFRALALLVSHPDRLAEAQTEIAASATETAPTLPLLRGTVLESLRLWATTPLILRETTQDVAFEYGVMPKGTSVLVFAPFFHRDDRNLDVAHTFSPELWDTERSRSDWPFVPFSAGPGLCPGRNLVLLLTANFLATVIGGRNLELESHNLTLGAMPSLLNNYGLTFRVG